MNICPETIRRNRLGTVGNSKQKHKLVLFYKMYNHLTPPYLSSLVPPLISIFSRYNLRNANDIQTIDSSTTLYFNSFLPFVIRDRNSLPYGNRNEDSLCSFKRQINHDRKNILEYYYSGTRRYQIIHTRLRTGCSSLNYDFFLKIFWIILFVDVTLAPLKMLIICFKLPAIPRITDRAIRHCLSVL